MKNLSYYIKKVVLSSGILRYIAQVTVGETKSNEDLINLIVEKFPQYTYNQVQELLDCYNEVLIEQIEAGYSIDTILGHLKYSIAGEFENSADHFDSTRQQIKGHITLNSNIKDTVKKIKVEKIEKPIMGPSIDQIVNALDNESKTMCPSGVLKVTGTNLKIVGSDENPTSKKGVFLENEEGDQFQCQALLTNKPGELLTVLPTSLELGSYNVIVYTHYYRSHIYQKVMETKSVDTIEIVESNEQITVQVE